MAVRRSRDEWLVLLAKFEASGDTAARFCAKRRIRPRTFGWWQWRLRDERHEHVVPEPERVRLIAVDLKRTVAPEAAMGVVRIALADFELRIETGTDVAYVAALVDALRSRC